MKKFNVTCTVIYNGSIEVEANDEDEAMAIASEEMSKETNFPSDAHFGDIDFTYGEGTVDFADELENF